MQLKTLRLGGSEARRVTVLAPARGGNGPLRMVFGMCKVKVSVAYVVRSCREVVYLSGVEVYRIMGSLNQGWQAR